MTSDSDSTLLLEQQLKHMQHELNSVQLCLNRLKEMSFDVQRGLTRDDINQNNKSFQNSAMRIEKQYSSTAILQSGHGGLHHVRSGRTPTIVIRTPQRPTLKFIQPGPKKTPSTPYDLYYSKDLLSEEKADEEEDSNMIHFDDNTTCSHVSLLTASEFSLCPGNFLHESEGDDTNIKTGPQFIGGCPNIQGNQRSSLHMNRPILEMDQLAPPSCQHPTPQRISRNNMMSDPIDELSFNDIHDVDVELLDAQRLHLPTLSMFDTQPSVSRRGPDRNSKGISSTLKRKIFKARKRIGRVFSMIKK
jgi:hypothetical protein